MAVIVLLFVPVFIIRTIALRRARALRGAFPLAVASSPGTQSPLRDGSPPTFVDPAWGTLLERAAWVVAAACFLFGDWREGLRPLVRAALIAALFVAAFGRLFVMALNARFAARLHTPPDGS